MGKNLGEEKVINAILSIIIFMGLVLALYYVFVWLGVEEGKAIIEAAIIASAIITPVVLCLFGRTWKKEL